MTRVPQLMLALVLCSGVAVASTPSKKEARKIAERAKEQSDIRSPLALPFRLTARITIRDSSGQVLPGSLRLIWTSEEQWREELNFPGYEEVRIGGPTKHWVLRTLNYEPVPMRSARSLLFPAPLGILPKEAIRRIRNLKSGGAELTCLNLSHEEYLPRELCFDREGRLTRYLQSGEVLEYSDYSQFGPKIFPRRVRAEFDGQFVMEAQVEELENDPTPAAALFEPPANAQEWDWCQNMKSATWLSGPMPDYDRLAFKYLDGGASAEVTISSVIGTDGLVHDVQVLQTGGKALDEATIEAMKQWRYKPAQCGERLVRMELVVTIPYHHVKMTSDCPGIGLSGNCAPRRIPQNTPVFTTPDPENPVPRSGRTNPQ